MLSLKTEGWYRSFFFTDVGSQVPRSFVFTSTLRPEVEQGLVSDSFRSVVDGPDGSRERV